MKFSYKIWSGIILLKAWHKTANKYDMLKRLLQNIKNHFTAQVQNMSEVNLCLNL